MALPAAHPGWPWQSRPEPTQVVSAASPTLDSAWPVPRSKSSAGSGSHGPSQSCTALWWRLFPVSTEGIIYLSTNFYASFWYKLCCHAMSNPPTKI